MKKVSIIVPVYNAQNFLEKCIESLTQQTLEEIELIFVNDGSTDQSLQILETYQKRFSDKMMVYSKENGGQASARNLGIAKSHGEYIGFIDADDDVDVNMYGAMYEKAKEESSDYVECQYHYLQVDDKGQEKEIPQYGRVRAYDSDKEMFIDPLVSPWNKLYRASILKEHQCLFTEGVIYEDTAFYIKVIPYLKKRSFIPEAYVYHYLWPGSTMNDKKYERIGNIFVVLEDAIKYYKDNGFEHLYGMELEYFCVKILLCSSLKRIAQINNKMIRNQLVKKTNQFIKEYFPEYRKNAYIRKGHTGLYMRCVNAVTIFAVVNVFRVSHKN